MVRILAISLLTAAAALAQKTPVVVELFTSEGCSSCPPADILLSKLPAAFPDLEIIPLSEHVDYWDHLGWKDRFSSSMFTERQYDYGRVFHVESVYTPQVVIGGRTQCSGNDPECVVQAVRKETAGPFASAQITLTSPKVMHIAVDNIPATVRNADVFLAVTEWNLDSSPTKGENAGAKLRHTGVVRTLTSLTHLDTKRASSYAIDAKLNPNPEWRTENLQYVLFVQDRATRKIIGAASLRLANK